METYHWDNLVTFHQDAIGCFTWDVPATFLERIETRVTTSPRRLVARWERFDGSIWIIQHEYCKTLCSLKVFKMKIDHLFLKILIVFSSLYRVIWTISSIILTNFCNGKYFNVTLHKCVLAYLGGLILKIFWHTTLIQ